MTHEELKILISAYADGEVSPSEKDIAEEHLSSCPSCQKDYKIYQAMSSSLSKWPQETLSPDEEINVQKRFEQRREPMFTKRNLMAFATTLVLTIIVGSVVQVQLHRGIQGRLKSATDDIGGQYSDGNTNVLHRQVSAGYLRYPSSKASEGQSFYGGPVSVDTLAKEARMQTVSGSRIDLAMNKKDEKQRAWNESAPMYEQAQAVAGFGGAVANTAPYNGPAYANSNTGYVQGMPQALLPPDHKIIKNADITLKVKNAQTAQSSLEGLVGKFNGVVNGLNMNKMEDGSRRGVMVLSVFPQDLDNFLREVRTLGEVESENQSGSDVTNQYNYFQARLKSYEAEKERLHKVLDKNSRDVENNLYIQGQIANVEENMNNVESNIKNLDKQSFMATVTVNFYDAVENVIKEASFKDKTIANLKSTLETCYNIAFHSFSGIVIILSFLLQIGLWALLFWGIYILVRRFYK
jgi:hypothetical protein